MPKKIERIIWSKEDLEKQNGMWVTRMSSPEGSGNLSFMASVTYKIGYIAGPIYDEHGVKNGLDEKYGLISVTDGMFLLFGTPTDLLEKLNNDRHGYRPTGEADYDGLTKYLRAQCNPHLHWDNEETEEGEA